ncbi:centromere protein J [Achlya hypogyna]|uniref:Centromere protein J n=1 Tax=Achlya hypogyna TaxID=1202772 RepID=A0A1V9ZN26_ACHHY|nr:centromere protein J [Achlya hypogyna]
MAARGAAMPGDNVSFEALLEKQWPAQGPPSGARKVKKKSFLKKGARGWWMENIPAKRKPYVLVSGDDAIPRPPTAAKSVTPAPSVQRRMSNEFTPRPAATPKSTPAQTPQTPLQSKRSENAVVVDAPTRPEKSEHPSYLDAPADLMQSFDWKLQQDADDLEEFEYLEQAMLAQSGDNFLDDYDGGMAHELLPPPEAHPPAWEKALLASEDHDDSLQFERWRQGLLQDDDGLEEKNEPELRFSSVQVAAPDELRHGSLDLSELSIADSEPWDIEASRNEEAAPPAAPSATSPLVQQLFHAPKASPPSSSLQTLKLKLQQKAVPKPKVTPKVLPKAAPKAVTAKKKPDASPARVVPPASVIPSVIDDKLAELELEVKHYKQETLKLQKRREALEADQRKLDAARQEWMEEKKRAQDEIEAEWKQIRKEKRSLDQTLKMGVGLLPDRKERAEIDALKAQIVKMKMDEAAKTAKQKAAMEFFRQRIAELEVRNQELRDELKFMEQERLAHWNWTPEPPAPTAATNTDDDAYDPQAYQEPALEENFLGWQSASMAERSSLQLEPGRGDYDASGVVPPPPPAPLPEPSAEAPPAAVAIVSEPAVPEVHEIRHPKGKVERRFATGPIAKTFVFANGTEKDVYVDGHTIVRFANGDIKEVVPSIRPGSHATYADKTVYFYAAAQTKHTTLADQTQVFEFPNHQIEKHFASGVKEITFVDGTTKRIEVNGDEVSVFPDGTRMLERATGFREVSNPDGSKARDYPDGRTTWVTPQGVETPIPASRRPS